MRFIFLQNVYLIHGGVGSPNSKKDVARVGCTVLLTLFSFFVVPVGVEELVVEHWTIFAGAKRSSRPVWNLDNIGRCDSVK